MKRLAGRAATSQSTALHCCSWRGMIILSAMFLVAEHGLYTLFIYHLDVYIAVSNVARDRNFSYARAVPKRPAYIQDNCIIPSGPEKWRAQCTSPARRPECAVPHRREHGRQIALMKSPVLPYLAHMGFLLLQGYGVSC